MTTPARTYGAYEADPAPYLAFLAIAAGLFISAPAVLGAIALARLARTARIVFAILSTLGLAWTWLAWSSIGLEMRRAARAAARAGGLEHPEAALTAAWPHIRTWWLLAAARVRPRPRDRAAAAPLRRGAARARRATRRARPRKG